MLLHQLRDHKDKTLTESAEYVASLLRQEGIEAREENFRIKTLQTLIDHLVNRHDNEEYKAIGVARWADENDHKLSVWIAMFCANTTLPMIDNKIIRAEAEQIISSISHNVRNNILVGSAIASRAKELYRYSSVKAYESFAISSVYWAANSFDRSNNRSARNALNSSVSTIANKKKKSFEDVMNRYLDVCTEAILMFPD